MFFGVLDFSTIVSNRILLKILVVRLLIGLYKSSWCIMEEQQVITLLPSLPSLSSFSLNHGPLFNMVWEPLHHAAKCLRYLSVGSERVSLFCGALGNSFFSFFDTVYFSSSCFFFRSQDRIFCCWVFFFYLQLFFDPCFFPIYCLFFLLLLLFLLQVTRPVLLLLFFLSLVVFYPFLLQWVVRILKDLWDFAKSMRRCRGVQANRGGLGKSIKGLRDGIKEALTKGTWDEGLRILSIWQS